MSASESFARTRVQKNNFSPNWDEDLILWAARPAAGAAAAAPLTLTLRVLDSDTLLDNNELLGTVGDAEVLGGGEVVLPAGWPEAAAEEMTVEITDRGKARGTVEIVVTPAPLGESGACCACCEQSCSKE